MVRRIIEIDRERCNGCGACAVACHEGAIGMKDGKAVLLRDDYCDGLGDCLPTCPTGAITFVEREAAAYDEAAVLAKKAKKLKGSAPVTRTGCPGSMARAMSRDGAPAAPFMESPPQPSEVVVVGRGGARERAQFSPQGEPDHSGLDVNCPAGARETPLGDCDSRGGPVSCLGQWPIQIKLLPVEAPFYDEAKLLIAADCTAFSRADFHQRFMRGHITMIGCPKLDDGDYAEKLTEIIRRNDIREVTVVRMEVPCCGGLQRAAEMALQNSGKFIPWQVVTLSRDGNIIE